MIPPKNTLEQSKDTGLAAVLLLLLAWHFTRLDNLILSAMATLILTMTWPMAFKPLSRIWFGLAHRLGGVVSKIILSVIFFGLVTPVGLVRRFGRMDTMRLKDWRGGDDTAFSARNHTFSATDLQNPY